jgi:aryl-alcohol dehydrogenase-like predicted oxidoreductase
MMIEKAMFGRTGHESTRAVFGAAALWDVSQEVADRTLDVLFEYGVNHIDTAASYGKSEDRVGPWMKRYRDQFFLATKTGERTKAKAWDEFRRSLDRLQTDHVDLLQLHFLVDEGEWQTAMGPGGALEAVLEAQAQGLTRFVGVTGHDLAVTRMHMRSLERHDFDSVLLPYNYPLSQNATFRQEFDTLLDTCRQRNIAVQIIKSVAVGPWGDKPHTRTTWYEALEDQADLDRAVWFVLGLPGVFLSTAGDVNLLPKVLNAASRFKKAPSAEEMKQMVSAETMTPLFT